MALLGVPRQRLVTVLDKKPQPMIVVVFDRLQQVLVALLIAV